MEQQTYYMTSNNSSTFSSDFTSIQNDNTYTKFNGDDIVTTITLANSFVFKNNSYNTIYLNSNGTLGFNIDSNTRGYPSINQAANMIGFFMLWVDLNSPAPTYNIYYKENTVNKTFNVLFNSIYYNEPTSIVEMELTLFLAGNVNSGNALFNFGSLTNSSMNSVFGFSFGSRNTANLVTNVNLNTNNIFTSSFSPYVTMTDTQSQLSNKQFLISSSQPQLTPTITNFSIPTKTFGDIPFPIYPPTSNSSGSFTYSSSDTSVATIYGSTITIVGSGSSIITATQAATTNYTSGTIETTFQVDQSTPTNPVIATSGDELLYFMNTTAIYCNITNSVEINEKLLASSYKVLNTTGDNVKITKTNN
jgi:hypothetical protein